MEEGPNASECPICFIQLSYQRVPMSMPCGHTLCKCCIDQLGSKATAALTGTDSKPSFPCPICRQLVAVDSVTVNVTLRDLLEELRRPQPRPGGGVGTALNIPYGDIKFTELLDRGAFGEVHRAYWQGYEVAVKVFSSGKLTSETLQAFQREVLVMNSLRHPNVVLLMGACQTPPTLCIVMEFVSGGSLYNLLHIDKVIMAMPDVQQVSLCTCRGLQYLHSINIMHRDLKSKNVLLMGPLPCQAKLCDFGLARLRQENATMTGNVGTLNWIAPEILKSMRYQFPADVYSFGMVLYEMAVNRVPYYGKNPMAIMLTVATQKERPPIHPGVHPKLAELIDRCTQWTPGDRPPVGEVLQSLMDLLPITERTKSHSAAQLELCHTNSLGCVFAFVSHTSTSNPADKERVDGLKKVVEEATPHVSEPCPPLLCSETGDLQLAMKLQHEEEEARRLQLEADEQLAQQLQNKESTFAVPVRDKRLSYKPDPTFTHKNVVNALKDVVEWKLLGDQLDISASKIKEIDINNRGQVADCRRALVQYWLESDVSCSWKKLIDALKSIHKSVLAEEIIRTYCPMYQDLPTSRPVTPVEGTDSTQSTPDRKASPLKRVSKARQPAGQKRYSASVVQRWKNAMNHPDFKLVVKRRKQAQDNWKYKRGSALADLQLQRVQGINKREADCGKNVTALHRGAFLTCSRTIQDTRRRVRGRRLIDDEVRLIVYQRAIEALLYPVSDPDDHKFESWNAMKPTYCSECGSLLWGLMKQGVKCSQCGKVCHEHCATLVSRECFAGYSRRSSMRDSVHAAITNKMNRTKQNSDQLFRLLREAFDIQSDDHDRHVKQIEQKILSLTDNFEAVVEVNVLAAEGLNLRTLSDTDRRIYVSVAVGSDHRRTATSDFVNPQWTETFVFHCNNYHEPIQVRVWNERDTTISKKREALTKEGDIFLGQKIIEVRRIGPPHDVWYKLDKRTETNPVSGSIKLNLSVDIEGENVKVPLQKQYKKLHEQLFLYSHYTNDNTLIDVVPTPAEDDEDKLKHLPPAAQQILDQFALRYSIENLFRSMIHMQLLVSHYTLPRALVVMANLLTNIQYQIFTHIAEDNSVRGVGATKLLDEHLEAINFGRDRFAKLLDKLMATLRLDLQKYREVYPANDPSKLEDLTSVCELMKAVVQFQMQGFQATSAAKLPEMIRDSMTANLKDTFEFIVQNCAPPNTTSHPGLSKEGEPFHFFYDVLDSIQSVVYEDALVYHPQIASSCDFNLGEVSAIELWKHFGTLISNLFESEENIKLFPSSCYLDLLFHIKNFYKSVVATAASKARILVDYPHWFVSCVKLWIHETEEKAVTYIGNAWAADMATKFQPYQGQPFSTSVFDTFFFLHKVLEYLVSIETDTDDELKAIYHHDFALLTCTVLGDYLKKISLYLPTCTTEPQRREAYMLVSNIHTMRIHLQELYKDIGGQQHAGQKCSETLKEFQNSVLGKELNSACKLMMASNKNDIVEATVEVQNSLLRIKGQKQDGLAGIKEESRTIIEPLMNAITKILQSIACVVKPSDSTSSPDQIVLHKLVKEVWSIVLESIQAMLLPNPRPECTSLQCACCKYSQRHCALFDVMLEVVKDFFSCDTTGLKQSVVENNIKRLKSIVGLYRKTTENLIADYISAEPPKETVGGDTYGEVAIELSTQIHPTTGELDGKIRVVSATNLKTFQAAGTLRISIEVYLLVSYAQGSKKFSTAQKTGTSSPCFCETFEFVLKEVSTSCELQITARQRSGTIFKNDRIIGVAVVPFGQLMAEAKQTVWLSGCVNMSASHSILFNVLSQRASDDATVKEFVSLKTQRRSQEDSVADKALKRSQEDSTEKAPVQ